MLDICFGGGGAPTPRTEGSPGSKIEDLAILAGRGQAKSEGAVESHFPRDLAPEYQHLL